MAGGKPASIDEYIGTFPADTHRYRGLGEAWVWSVAPLTRGQGERATSASASAQATECRGVAVCQVLTVLSRPPAIGR